VQERNIGKRSEKKKGGGTLLAIGIAVGLIIVTGVKLYTKSKLKTMDGCGKVSDESKDGKSTINI